MNPIQAPRIAEWLLRHFGSSPNNDVVLGDLNERYQRGRSRIWYWRQALIAIIESLLSEVRRQKRMRFHALLLGIGLQLLSSNLIGRVGGLLFQHRHQWGASNPHLVLMLLTVLLCALSGRFAWSHRPHGRAMVLMFSAWQLVPVFSLPVIGQLASPFSWIFEVASYLNLLLWNTYGLTVLDDACAICTTRSWYGLFLFGTSGLMTLLCLIVGSGVLTERSNGPSVQPTHATT